MKNYLKPASVSWTVCAAALMASLPTAAEDIDIFRPANNKSGAPNVLIMLDNTSNWARQSQQWPGGVQQGQSEVNAIKRMLDKLAQRAADPSAPPINLNLGLLEFVTEGNANDDGGFIRYAVKDMSLAANRNALRTKLNDESVPPPAVYQDIYHRITSPKEKRNSNTPYGNLMYDVYNYFGKYFTSPIPDHNYWNKPDAPNGDPDPSGYSVNYSHFNSPLPATETCGKNYIIFIGNPNASGPASDTEDNTNLLKLVGGDATQIYLPGVTSTTVVSETVTTFIANTSACYASADAAKTAYGYGLNSADNLCQLYAAKGSFVKSATAQNNATCNQYSDSVTPPDTGLATATDFSTACAAFTEGCTVGEQSFSTINLPPVSGKTGYLKDAPTGADAGAQAGLACPSNAVTCSFTVAASTDTADIVPARASDTGDTTSCYYAGNGSNPDNVPVWTASTGDFGSLTTDCSDTDPTKKYTCSYTKIGSDQDASCSQKGNVKRAVLQRTSTPKTIYKVTMQVGISGDGCPAGTHQYKIFGNNKVYSNVLTTSTVLDTGPRNADEWARFLFQKGVPISQDGKTRAPVATYTIDVYNKQPNAEHTALLMSMAKVGGGKYFVAKKEDDILTALMNILTEIQAVNSTFASASLPVNATNRAQNDNQVFIGMFRPDSKPRWFGNLKRYKLIKNGSNIELGDVNDQPAVNTNTGFVTECATSFWTTASGSYWKTVTDGTQLLDPKTIKGTCDNYDPYSDLPDGPLVEKGAVAEVLRKGNNPGVAPTWTVNRKIYTHSGGTLIDFTAGSLSANLFNFMIGKDVNNEKGADDAAASALQTRPSIHGDVLHSRPLPINYGNDKIVVYYGSNDGMLRAVEASTGKELWAFIAPEFLDTTRLNRLMNNSPNNNIPAVLGSSNNKDYFFDGSIGFYQAAKNSKVWIFPTMRRGGRMIYALDVTNPDAPAMKWAKGCPNLGDDNGCSDKMSGIGQTWSTPRGARIKGYSETEPVIFVGGGYDACEDENSKTPSCGTSSKGRVVYVLKASDGTPIRSFEFPNGRSIASDVTLVDVNADGYVDYAYAADTTGNIYRMDFIDADKTPRKDPSTWTSRRVAYTNGSGRKFLFGPSVFTLNGKAYLALGSGDREHPLGEQYPTTESVTNRFYVYKDDLAVNDVTAAAVNLDDDKVMRGLTANTSCDDPPLLPSSIEKGWFMDLDKGEQVVTSTLIAGGMAYFSTNLPKTADTNACTPSLGEARGYAVNLFNRSGGIGTPDACGGASYGEFVGGGLPPSPVEVIVDGETVCIPCASKRKGNSPIDATKVKFLVPPKRKRIYSYIKGDN